MKPANKTTRFHEEEIGFAGKYSRSVFQTLFFAYHQFLRSFALLFFVGLVGRMAILFNANLVGYWVDLLAGNSEHLPYFVKGWRETEFVHAMLAVTVIGLIATLVFRIGFSRMSAQAVSSLYDETTLRTSRYPISFFDSTPVGRVITRFSSDYGNVFRMFGGPLAEFVNIIFDLISMVVLAMSASYYFGVVVLVMGVLYTWVYRFNRDCLRVARREYSRARSPSIAHFAETAQGASIIRAFSRESVFMARFRRLNTQFLVERLNTIRRVITFSFEMNLLSAFIFVLTGAGGYLLIRHGLLSVGDLTVAFSFLLLASSSLQMFFEWMSQMEDALVGVERLDDYLRRPLEKGLRLPAGPRFATGHPVSRAANQPASHAKEDDPSGSQKIILGRSAEVIIDHLNFRYRPELPFVLKDFSLVVRAGEKMGVVGRTGSGKSTFVQCLYYLYPFQSGKIEIGGLRPQIETSRPPLRGEISLTEFRKNIALISQESILFKGPLRDNLDMDHRFRDDEIWSVLERVGMGQQLRLRSGGLERIVDERGRNLSMGERQLVCIARCLLQNSPVVVMDEATSSIDPATEEILMRATRELFRDRTQIIIAHRLSTLQYCDRILWLKDGAIHRLGPTADILPLFERDQFLAVTEPESLR